MEGQIGKETLKSSLKGEWLRIGVGRTGGDLEMTHELTPDQDSPLYTPNGINISPNASQAGGDKQIGKRRILWKGNRGRDYDSHFYDCRTHRSRCSHSRRPSELGGRRGSPDGSRSIGHGNGVGLLPSERVRHPQGTQRLVHFGLIAIMFLFLLALALPTTAVAQVSVDPPALWETLEPLPLDTSGPNITYELRGIVHNMGDNTVLNVSWILTQGVGEVGWRDVAGPENGTPSQPLQTFEIDLVPETEFLVYFIVNDNGGNIANMPKTSNGRLAFASLAVGDIIPFVVHPLEGPLNSLGLDVNISLGVIGIMLMAMPFAIITLLGKNVTNADLIPAFLMIASANVFLRFWPPIVLIFLALFAGYTFMSRVGGKDNAV